MSAKEREIAPQFGTYPSDADIDLVFETYERGFAVDAWKRAEAIGPLSEWRGTRACIVAARIAAHTGAGSLALKLAARGWKRDRDNAAAVVQYGYEVLGFRGALRVWELLSAWTEVADARKEDVAELFALRAYSAAVLRDFSTAEQWLHRAEQLALHPWIRLQRAHLLEFQDRVEEALEVATAACALHRHPHYRAGIQTRAHLLQLLDRDDEAIALLSDAHRHVQSASIVAQLYSILSENDRWREAADALEQYPNFAPLMGERSRQWLTAQRARVEYRLGLREQARQHATELDDEFHKAFANRLQHEPLPQERVQLGVTFVRQHFKTCAPATLAALGRFWKMPAEHLQLAEAVCYDGTPHWQQRSWAEANGWFVREFRVTRESAHALLARGVPFAISTVDSSSAHMMAVIGFDLARGTLLLRDPGQPYVIETVADEFLEQQRAFGPRGTLFIPNQERERVADVDLPDAALYDAYYGVTYALSQNARERAAASLTVLEQLEPESIVTWDARYEIACYDGNPSEQLRCATAALALFPDNPSRILRRFYCLAERGNQQRIEFLSTCVSKSADPAILIAFARAIQGDARRAGEAKRAVRRALRRRSMEAGAFAVLADLTWDEMRYETARDLYRFAATIESTREDLYQSWFIACSRTRLAQPALEHLEDRFARFGARSSQPALTLAWGWVQMEQPQKAAEVLDAAIGLRPNDGALLLRAATLRAECGDAVAADRLLHDAASKVRENDWLRAKLTIAENRFEFSVALEVAQRILASEPLALDAHSAVARALSRTQGAASALEALKLASAAHPHHVGLLRMRAEWSRDAGPAAVESAIRALLRVEPSDPWAYRELALALSRQNRSDEALAAAQQAVHIEPMSTYSASILALVQTRAGLASEARAQLRRAIEISVDNEDAISQWLDLATGDAERKQILAFVEQELVRQVVLGNGLITFGELARPILDADSLLSLLRTARDTRPDLWHAWSALTMQLGHMQRLDEALEVAREATTRFPHLPRVWLDLASVHQWRDELQSEIEAATRAVELNPAWSEAVLALTSPLLRAERLDDAQIVFERGLRHAPLEARLNAVYGHFLWRRQDIEGAFAAIEQALRIAPNYAWPWDLLVEWSEQVQQLDRPKSFVRQLIEQRPGEVRGWLMLAAVLNASDESQQRFEALDRAIELDPRLVESWDLKAELQALAERFDAAVATCREGLTHVALEPHILRGRIAWIEGRRRRYPEAIRLMREVLADNAGYVWGWHQLTIWLQEQGDFSGAAEAFEVLRRLRPHDGWLSRQLGFCLLKQEKKPEAEDAFREAFLASPTDNLAAQNLFDLQLARNDVPAASETVRIMKLHQPGGGTLAAEIAVRLRQGHTRQALESLEQLAKLPDPDDWPMSAATDAFVSAGLVPKALRVLQRALRSGGNPECAVSIVRLFCSQRRYAAATWFFWRLPPGEARRRTAAPLMQLLAQAQKAVLIGWLLKTRRSAFQDDDAAWGQVGYALTMQENMAGVAEWLDDWRTRPNVQPWMLFNYCLALRCRHRVEEATQIAQWVLSEWGHRDGAADMHVFIAIEAAFADDIAGARSHLELADARKSTLYESQIITLARVILDFRSMPNDERAREWPALRATLEPVFPLGQTWKSMRDVRASLRRAASLFGSEGGGLRAWMWCRWRLHWQWSLLVLLPAVPVAIVALGTSTPFVGGVLFWLMIGSVLRRRA